MSDEQRPSIEPIAKRLSSLKNTPDMAQVAHENPKFIEDTIFQGFDGLIRRFNATSKGDIDLQLAPKVGELKQKLADLTLPQLDELGGKDLIKGIREAEPLMAMGQAIKAGKVDGTEKNKEAAIGSPSMETNTDALLVGTAGHLLERTIFNYLRQQGIEDWTKDEVLFALEDIALIMHAEKIVGRGEDSPLFPFIASPNSLSSEGGLGWRKQEQVDELIEKYNKLHGILPSSESERFSGNVRALKEEDFPQLRPILMQGVVDSETKEPLLDEIEEIMQSMQKSLKTRTQEFLVADDNGKILGLVGLRFPDSRMLPYAQTPRPIELVNLFVAQNIRSQGTGKALVDGLINRAKEKQNTEVILNSGPRYKDTAWGFYDKLPGFERVGVAPDYYGPGRNAPVWRKLLID